METRQPASNYDRIAPRWASAEFNLQNGIVQHERALKFLGRAGTAIDVGCGSSGRIIALLLTRGFEVEGLDFSKSERAGAGGCKWDLLAWEETTIVVQSAGDCGSWCEEVTEPMADPTSYNHRTRRWAMVTNACIPWVNLTEQTCRVVDGCITELARRDRGWVKERDPFRAQSG